MPFSISLRTLSTSPSASSSSPSSSSSSGSISPTISSIMPAFINSWLSACMVPVSSGNLTSTFTSFMMPVLALRLPSICRTENASFTCICTLCSCALLVCSRADCFRTLTNSLANVRASLLAWLACEGVFCALLDAATINALVFCSTTRNWVISRSSFRVFWRMSSLHFRICSLGSGLKKTALMDCMSIAVAAHSTVE